MVDYKGLGALHPFCCVWRNMKARCENINSNRFNTYGARGITVDASWQDFFNFYNDMFPTWYHGKQIDRKDNDKGYNKDNCQWTTPAKNSQKRTNSKMTREKADEIKKRFHAGAAYQELLAKEFGVSSRMIRYIGTGKSWK